MFENFEKPVQCSKGHLYTTIWIPLVSFKSIRMGWGGWLRWQWCPVGRHWSRARPLENPTPEQLAEAAKKHDLRIP